MTLRLQSRPVGDVLVVQCYGRIVAGDGPGGLRRLLTSPPRVLS